MKLHDIYPIMVLIEKAYGELVEIVNKDRKLGKYVADTAEYVDIYNKLNGCIGLLRAALGLIGPVGCDMDAPLGEHRGVEGPKGEGLKRNYPVEYTNADF